MRRVWATVVAVWATLSIVAALAWMSRPAPGPLSQPVATTLLVKGKQGTQRFVVHGSTAATAPHATTQTSPVPAG